MGLLEWLSGVFTDRGKALSLCRRGITRANEHDCDGAISDYTAVLGMQAAPPDVKAMALYNRALTYAATGDESRASEDLEAVLAMPEAPAEVKTAARQRCERIKRRGERNNPSSQSTTDAEG
jgi:hypothetical protein